MKDYGFVKLYRSLHDWEWYTEPNAMRLFIHFLTTVNYKEKNWQGRIIMPGQTVTSRTKLANELKLSEQQIRTALNRLKSTNNITIEATSKYSIVTVCNWEFYQSREDESTSESTSESTNEQPAINQQSTTTKEYKKTKKEKKNKEGQFEISVPDYLTESFASFVEMRKVKKSPMTEHAKELMLKKLYGLSSDHDEQVAILNNSIAGSWTDIYPLKNNSQYQKPQQREVPLTEVEDGLFKIG